MTEQQALERLKADIQLSGLSESTCKNYSGNLKKFKKLCRTQANNILLTIVCDTQYNELGGGDSAGG